MTAWHDPLSKKYQTRRPNKFKAQRTDINGISFDSKGESEMHGMLLLMEKAKAIKNIRLKPVIQLTPSVKFRIDWVVFDCELKEDVGIEFKGVDGERWRVIKQLWKDFGPFRIRVYKKDKNRIFMAEEIWGAK